ncbi:FMN reductase [Lentzea sp. NBRC 105346]|uniref:flavodoxin family protein n=1 Tax=Lentzea sp. NBRC 105346 TaxID=3032205 RepID=UPI0024A39B08|nr:flavodoxin family protein [Lentzea sp. NBRC 105346]GLZ35024.1 FMN reductase [Lentzea sp. NBRC 105346]
MQSPVQIAIAYHSGTGQTAKFAAAVHEGASSVTGCESVLIPVDSMDEPEWATLDAADAIIFGSPTYMGGASAAFHGFAEATSRRWMRQSWQDKLAAGFTNSGSKAGDKSSTLAYFATLAAQHGMTWVNLGLLPGWNRVHASEHDLNRLGFHSGAAAQSNVDSREVHAADLATAAHLGRRVAEQALVLAAGRAALAPAR